MWIFLNRFYIEIFNTDPDSSQVSFAMLDFPKICSHERRAMLDATTASFKVQSQTQKWLKVRMWLDPTKRELRFQHRDFSFLIQCKKIFTLM